MMRFPDGFTWGAATSSHQIEGAWLEGGKGLSVWDAFSHTPGKIANGDTGDIACDHYHRYKEDVALMASMGLKAYRLSLSWPRIQPTGRGAPNAEGIRFYSDLIDSLLENGITPWVTLYHWDLPLALELELDGWLNPRLPECFRDYAAICFQHFGDRVKHWITINEPWVVSVMGYGQGVFAPGRTSPDEPYLVAHQILRAHGMAVDLYRRQFQQKQGGIIGITNNCDWREPLTTSEQDRQAAQRTLEFFLAWFADPVYRGEYPPVMRNRLGERLPRLTPDDLALIRGSSDFFGINHYSTMFASEAKPGAGLGFPLSDQDVSLSADPAWPTTQMGWAVVPWGCRKLLEWIDHRYERPEIVITENGCALDDRIVEGMVHDQQRIDYLRSYIGGCHAAIQKGVKLKGYFLWSFLDNFEWSLGFKPRFGIHYVDFATGKRTPKTSAKWYGDVIRNNGMA